ncbi:DUF2336 domain-containing protein [Prosthecomicrobium sp. N25]|uniref:DUF2336 domain-containing protein n=1 Tax=Prosthecomicrobium sp. N25 TaxID=3129254 RepID=UPI003077B930
MDRPVLATLASSFESYLSRKIGDRGSDDALARQLAQLFAMTGEDADAEALGVFDRIFGRLVEAVEADTRGYLSIQFSVMTNPPRATLLRLARDIITVARPILIHSPALAEADLVAILADTGLGHMGAVAERGDLTVTVTDIIVERGDDAVRRVLAGNHAALLSARGFRRLSLQARADERLEAVLIGRADVPDIVVRFLVRHGPGHARGRGTDVSREGEGTWTLPERPAETWALMYDFDAAEARVMALADLGHRGEPLLLRLVAEERFPEAVIVLAHLVQVRRDDMIGWLTARDAGPFLQACKTIPLEVRTVFGLLGLGPWRQMLDGRARQEAVRAYQGLEPGSARAWLAAWRRRAAAEAGR